MVDLHTFRGGRIYLGDLLIVPDERVLDHPKRVLSEHLMASR